MCLIIGGDKMVISSSGAARGGKSVRVECAAKRSLLFGGLYIFYFVFIYMTETFFLTGNHGKILGCQKNIVLNHKRY